jgi:hypothetical protein
MRLPLLPALLAAIPAVAQAAPVPLDLACTIIAPQFRTELSAGPANLRQGSISMKWQPASISGDAPARAYHAARLTVALSIGGAHLFDRVSTIFGGALEAREQDTPAMFRDGGQKLYYSDARRHTAQDITASITPQGVYVSGLSSISLYHETSNAILYAANIFTEQVAGDGFVNISGQCTTTPSEK